MSQAIVVRAYGDADVMRMEDVDVATPQAGEVRLRQTAIGVNFHDVYVRSGQYTALALPGTPGIEAAGVVEAVGPGVDGFQSGDRVAYVTHRYGAYAAARVIPAQFLVKIPEGIEDATAAAALVKGLTSVMLTTRLRPLRAGDSCLVYAAAGGVGQFLCQMARRAGARVIGVVGSAAKVSVAMASGCTDVIVRTKEDVGARVMDLTATRGVDVVYDSVGADTFETSLNVLAPCGLLANFGQSSGPVAPFPPARLAAKSNTVWRPILFHYLTDTAQYRAMAHDLFTAFENGALKVSPPTVFALREAVQAHRALESAGTTHSIVLTPAD